MLSAFYDDLAPVYHLFFRDWDEAIKEQAACLSKLLPSPSLAGPILDCACGIGTQTLGLAAMGFEIAGSDLSPLEIERASREARTRGYDIDFRVDDMRELSSGRPLHYGAILCMGNSLPHLQSEGEIRTALQNMNRKLRHHATIMFSIRDYDTALHERPTSTTPSFFADGPSRRILHHVWDWTDDRSYVFHVYLTTEDHGRWQVHHSVGHYRALRSGELVSLLYESGFENAEVLPPAKTGYYQLIVRARKAKTV